MPRKSSKNSESISALQRRSSRVTLPAAQSTTAVPASASASASPGPSPSTTIPLSVPVANAKNIDDINWRHPAELELIYPTASTQADIIPILQKQAFSVPPHPTDPNETFCTITLGLGLDAERVQVVIPLGYRIPLLFCGKYLWESVRLVLTSVDPPPEKEWDQYKFDLLNLSRLCYTFLQSALATMRRKGKGMTKRWRSQTFDRVLTRYFWGWMVNREEFIRLFWFEFKEEEYERDVCRRDWRSTVLQGHNGFHLTESEIANGITAEQFTAGLLSLPPQLSSSGGMTYKWDNTLYALANELVITGSRVRERQDSDEDRQEGGWEGEEGRSRKRMKIDVDPADAEQVAFDLVHGRAGGDDDVEMVDGIVVGEVLPSPLESASRQAGESTTRQRHLTPPFPTSNMRGSTGDESLSAIASALALPALDSEPSRSNAASPRPGVVYLSSTAAKSVVGPGRVDAAIGQRTVTEKRALASGAPRAVSQTDATSSDTPDEPRSVPMDKRAENILVVSALGESSAQITTSASTTSTPEHALAPTTSNIIQPSSSSSAHSSLPNDFRPSNPEVINQVLEIVPGMLSQLRTIMDVAHSEKTLLSPGADNTSREAALEKMQSTTATLDSSSSSSTMSAELMNSLIERVKALESDIKSDRERRAKENDEWDRMQKKIGELEEQVRGYEALSLNHANGGGHGVNGNNGVPERYRTPLSRTSSIDENCPLPVKSKRKHMNLIAMSESPRPS